MNAAAVFSPCRTWRYVLERCWDESLPTVCFIALNPSTANETVDDPTIRRLLGFARAWGFGRLLVTNLFAFRATDPRALKRAADPIGPDNDAHLRDCAQQASMVVICWGNHGTLQGRDVEVMGVLRGFAHNVRHFGLTRTGQPKHPLYLPASMETIELVAE